MRPIHKLRTKAVSLNFQPIVISFFLFLSCLILFTNNVHASGSKMPDVASGVATGGAPDDGTVTGPANSSTYSHLDPGHIVPSALLSKAVGYYDANKSRLGNTEYIGVIDFSQFSAKERFYIIDMQSGQVDTYQVANGKNSDPDYDGYATQFSNEPNSEMSSQGIYVTAETYQGDHGYSLKLDGKSPTNSNARSRAIVIHPADYVQPGAKIGRSWGCPALDPRYSEEVINKLKGGAVIYAH